MNTTRRAMLLNKASNFTLKLKTGKYTDDGKAVYTLLYQIDTMIYGLASINTEDWRTFLKELKEAKYMLRIHSRDESVKEENFNKATTAILQTLDRYIGYLQLQTNESV